MSKFLLWLEKLVSEWTLEHKIKLVYFYFVGCITGCFHNLGKEFKVVNLTFFLKKTTAGGCLLDVSVYRTWCFSGGVILGIDFVSFKEAQ